MATIVVVRRCLQKLFPVDRTVPSRFDSAFFEKYNQIVKAREVNGKWIWAIFMLLAFHAGFYFVLSVSFAYVIMGWIPMICLIVPMLFVTYKRKDLFLYVAPLGILVLLLFAINVAFVFIIKLTDWNVWLVYAGYICIFFGYYLAAYRLQYKNIVEIVKKAYRPKSNRSSIIGGVMAFLISRFLLSITTPVAIALMGLAVLLLLVPAFVREMLPIRYYHTIQNLKPGEEP